MDEPAAWREALWRVYEDNHVYVRHHEVQRSTVATLIISIASAALAIATFDQKLSPTDVPLLAVVVGLGVFGILFSKKQFERTCMHVARTNALLTELEKTFDGRSILKITNEAEATHSKEFRLLSKFHMNTLWALFYGFPLSP